MGMRKKLMKLLCNAHGIATDASLFENASYAEQLKTEADFLIANGVTFDRDINVLTKKIAKLEKSNRNWRRKYQRLKATRKADGERRTDDSGT